MMNDVTVFKAVMKSASPCCSHAPLWSCVQLCWRPPVSTGYPLVGACSKGQWCISDMLPSAVLSQCTKTHTPAERGWPPFTPLVRPWCDGGAVTSCGTDTYVRRELCAAVAWANQAKPQHSRYSHLFIRVMPWVASVLHRYPSNLDVVGGRLSLLQGCCCRLMLLGPPLGPAAAGESGCCCGVAEGPSRPSRAGSGAFELIAAFDYPDCWDPIKSSSSK